jgi:hypothetical protein
MAREVDPSSVTRDDDDAGRRELPRAIGGHPEPALARPTRAAKADRRRLKKRAVAFAKQDRRSLFGERVQKALRIGGVVDRNGVAP